MPCITKLGVKFRNIITIGIGKTISDQKENGSIMYINIIPLQTSLFY